MSHTNGPIEDSFEAYLATVCGGAITRQSHPHQWHDLRDAFYGGAMTCMIWAEKRPLSLVEKEIVDYPLRGTLDRVADGLEADS